MEIPWETKLKKYKKYSDKQGIKSLIYGIPFSQGHNNHYFLVYMYLFFIWISSWNAYSVIMHDKWYHDFHKSVADFENKSNFDPLARTLLVENNVIFSALEGALGVW